MADGKKLEHPYLMSVRWDQEWGVLVDEQGIMLTKEEVEYLGYHCFKHMKEHTPLEREAIGRRTVERHGKGTALQFNFDLFREDADGPADQQQDGVGEQGGAADPRVR